MTRSDLHIAVLFPMDTVRHSLGQSARMWGRVVANHDFLRAVAKSRLYGRLSVFVPTEADVKVLSSTLLSGFESDVLVVAYRHLEKHLAANPVDVLHVPDPNLFAGTHIRNSFPGRSFVVTGITHSLANQHFIAWALQNHANGVGPEDCLICTTPTAQNVVESMFADLREGQPDFAAPQTRVLPLGITPDDRVPDSEAARRALNIGADEFVMLSFCRFDHAFKMDLLPLIGTVESVHAGTDRPIRLILAGASGDGAYARYVQKFIDDNSIDGVRLMPDCEDAQKATLFGAADVFVSLSDNVQETFGLTVVEAMTAGLPVVASDWDGYRSLVIHRETGFLVPTMVSGNDPDWDAALALHDDRTAHLFQAQTTAVDARRATEFLQALACDDGLARRLGEAGKARASQYQWDRVIGAYFELWAELSDARPKGASRKRLHRSSAVGFLRNFSGYATSKLSGTDRFTTSATGSGLLEGKTFLQPYALLEEFLDREVISAILTFFVNERSVAELLTHEAETGKGDASSLSRNLLWLYKHGFLEAR